MSQLTVRVRTKDNLLHLLSQEESPAWIIAKGKVQSITHVQIVNFAGTQMIEGVFDPDQSQWIKDDKGNDRLVLKFREGRIVNCQVEFPGQNPVNYPVDNLNSADNSDDYAVIIEQ